MKKIIAIIGVLSLLAVCVPVMADTTDDVIATVTPQLISVSVDTPSVDYGVLDVGETSVPSAVITATNDGNVTEKFEIMSSDSTGWTISNTAVGAEIFMHEFATDDDAYANYTAMDDAAYNTLDASVATPSGTQLFKLRLKMPSSTTVTETQSTTVTILATEAS